MEFLFHEKISNLLLQLCENLSKNNNIQHVNTYIKQSINGCLSNMWWGR